MSREHIVKSIDCMGPTLYLSYLVTGDRIAERMRTPFILPIILL
jgi:hypothetical protein